MVFRRISAGVVLILAMIGFLVCCAVDIGARFARVTVDGGVEIGIAALSGYLDVATEAIHQVDADLTEMQTAVNGISQQAQEGPVSPDLAADLAPRLQDLGNLVGRLQGGLTTFGTAAEVGDALPGIDAAPLTERLQSVNDGLTRMQSSIEEMQAAIAQGDGTRVVALSTSIADAVADTRAKLADIQANIAATQSSLAATQKEVPRYTLLGMLAIALLFGLFAAGQISLMARAWQALRYPSGRRRGRSVRSGNHTRQPQSGRTGTRSGRAAPVGRAPQRAKETL